MDKNRGGSDRRGRGGRRDDRDTGGLEETVVKINRTAKVVTGGRRFSFSALVVVGDKRGKAGWGFGKANSVPLAVAKATKNARASVGRIPLKKATIEHETWGRYRSSRVYMQPAAPGTGVIAGGAARAVFTAAGVHDILCKAYGSTNPLNLVKAVFEGLTQMRSREEVERLRGVKL